MTKKGFNMYVTGDRINDGRWRNDDICFEDEKVQIKIMKVKTFYDKWLIENYSKFRYKPYVAEYEPEDEHPRLVIQFENIPHLCFIIDEQYQAGMFVFECKRFWDIILDCDLFPEKTDNGKFFCSECNKQLERVGKEGVFWDSEQEMWNDHVFDELLKWCNQKLTPDNVLACYGIPGKSCWGAEIITAKEIDEYRKKGSKFLSLVNPYRT